MSLLISDKPGRRALCIDGGGIRGYFTLRVLQQLKTLTNKEPHQLFDLICGSGSGGVLAIMLGLLKIPVDECMEVYEKLSKEVLEVGWLPTGALDQPLLSSEKLERFIKQLIIQHDYDPDVMLSEVAPNPTHEQPTPRVFVVARRGQSAYLFRNYHDTDDGGTAGSSDARVWEAACATSATPTLFDPVSIGRNQYVDGGLGHNNPTLDALAECSRIPAWQDRPMACIVSLGTGIKTIRIINSADDVSSISDSLFQTATDCERTHEGLNHQQRIKGVYFRFNVSDGVGDFERGEEDVISAMIEATESYLAQHSTIDCLEKVQSCLLNVAVKNRPASDKIDSFNLPQPNTYFTGRSEHLNKLHNLMDSHATVAVSHVSAIGGLGGIGKTDLAIQYVYQHWDPQCLVFWIQAENVTAEFTLLGEHLGIVGSDTKQSEAVENVKQWLESNDGWLLIFDNADDIPKVQKFFPSHRHNGRILLTTRAQHVRDIQTVALDAMSSEEGVSLLLKTARLDHSLLSPADLEAAKELARLLDGLPLALEIAGAYIERTQCSLQSYLGHYRSNVGTVLDESSWGGRYPRSIRATWRISIDAASKANAAAAGLLHICSLLHADSIPMAMIETGIAQHWEVPGTDGIQRRLDVAVQVLRRYSLLDRDGSKDALSMHRLVQVAVQSEMDQATIRRWALVVVAGVSDYIDSISSDEYYLDRQRMLPHTRLCIEHISRHGVRCDGVLRLIWQCCKDLAANGGFEGAHEYLELGHRMTRDEHGDNSEKYADCQDTYGQVLWREGRYTEAESRHKDALAIRERVLGSDHLLVAESLNNLAVLYKCQGKYSEAEPLHRRALAIRGKSLGSDHPDIARSLNNLASLYTSQGKYAEAEPLYRRALVIREKSLGSDHPFVANSLNNLADLYEGQGKYDEAEPLYRRALAIREKSLGSDHPDVADSLNNFACLYMRQGKYTEAEPLFRRALAIHETSLGSDHPDVAASLGNLAFLYRNQGKYTEAEPLFRRALAIHETSLGSDHPDVAFSLNSLALLYLNQGKYTEAEPLHQRALAIREKSLRPDHPDVAISLNNLASLYESQGKYTEAEPLHRRALTIREKSLGSDHPDVATSLNGLAILYKSQGKYDEAEQLHRRALAIREKSLGSDHPSVAESLNNIASLYKSQDKYSEAEQLYRRALAIRKKSLGSDHPDTAVSRDNLALLYRSQGRHAEADGLYSGSQN